MEKLCGKPAVKASSIGPFSLANSPKQSMHV